MAHFNAKGKSMEEEIAKYVNFTKIIPGFKNLHPKDVSNLLKASHCEFWLLGNYMLINKDLGTSLGWNGSFGSTIKMIEKFWSPEWVQMVFKLADMIQKLELSLEEIVLVRVILLTYTDRCKLKDREKIQILQEKFLDCLNFQLMKSHKDYNRYLYKIFDILLRIRDLTELNFKVNQKFLQEWGFAIHEFPLWKEMLSYENDV
ncbi:nuclear receptor subfamily 1 group D member 2-like [Ruditapes philippinarum]|uniref:nuclear receptor subfamily 1 group D member 2-like n=1 Tax=Ruditapes philippinarum TaxID=129788 RepID=UPI00295ADFD0|nr:nuclear receptor subfamily 1 group D member 2-like [Ruditapes philippinarum]